MSISIGTNSLNSIVATIANDSGKAENLKAKLSNRQANGEELMEACKSFEAYLLEQVFEHMKKTIPESEDENPYLDQFGGILYQEYAKKISDNQSLGIAGMLYEAMKRNT